MSEHEANTNEVLFSKHNINHEEGGWPKDVDYAEAEHTIRFRKKVEKDEDYVNTVVNLGARVEARAMQNNAIDIYRRYFSSDLTDIVAEVCYDLCGCLRMLRFIAGKGTSSLQAMVQQLLAVCRMALRP